MSDGSSAGAPERSPQPGDVRGILRKVLLIAVVETLAVILIAIINPFGIVDYTARRSHEQWEQIVGADYEPKPLQNAQPGASRSSQPGDARDLITIVSLSDDTLGKTGFKRPLVWSNHEAMLDSVAFQPALAGDPPPAGIFIDFVLANGAADPSAAAPTTQKATEDLLSACESAPHPGQDRFQCYVAKVAKVTHYWGWAGDPQCQTSPLAKIVCIRDHGGVPVIFADPRTSADLVAAPHATTDPVMATLGQVAVLASAQISTTDGYWLATPGRVADRENLDFTLSPAAALYAAFCAVPTGAQSPCLRPPAQTEGGGAAPTRLGWSHDFDSPVDVAWGVGGPDYFTDMLENFHPGTLAQRCKIESPDIAAVIGRIATRALTGLFNRPLPRPCPYSHDLPYADLDNANMTRPALEAALSGKLVLIGGEFSDTNDSVPTPFQYQLPGVYYHAMALDNLIQADQAGRPYSKFFPNWTPLAINRGDLGNFAFTFIFSIIASLAIITLNPAKQNSKPLGGLGHLANPWRLAILWTYLLGPPLFGFIVARQFPNILQYFNIALIFFVWIGTFSRVLLSYVRPSSYLFRSVEAFHRDLQLDEVHWPDPAAPPPPPEPSPPPPPSPGESS